MNGDSIPGGDGDDETPEDQPPPGDDSPQGGDGDDQSPGDDQLPNDDSPGGGDGEDPVSGAPVFDDASTEIKVGDRLIPLTGKVELGKFEFSEPDGDSITVSIDITAGDGSDALEDLTLSHELFQFAGSGRVTLFASAKSSALAPTLADLVGSTVTISISDDDGTDGISLSFSLAENNTPPEFDGLAGQTSPVYFFRVPSDVGFGTVLGTVSATDPDGDSISYSLETSGVVPANTTAKNALAIGFQGGKIQVLNPDSLKAVLEANDTVSVLARATDFPNSFGLATIQLSLADDLDSDTIEQLVDNRLQLYRTRLGALIDAGAARSRQTAQSMQEDLGNSGWDAALTGFAANSLKDIGAAFIGSPAGLASYIAGVTLQAAWELRNPNVLPPMEGEEEEVTTIEESIERIRVRGHAEMEAVVATLSNAKTALMTSPAYQNASDAEKSAMLQGHLDYVVEQTPGADISAIDADSSTPATAFDTALATLPSSQESAKKMIFMALSNAGKTLEFLGYTIFGNPDWNVVGSPDIPGFFNWEDLADWLEDNGVDHPTVGVVDLQSLIN